MWGDPVVISRGEGQPPLNLLLFDTEGFEATGKADAYDDRIFALSTVLSAVLIYNLPETVREYNVQVSVSLSHLRYHHRLLIACSFSPRLGVGALKPDHQVNGNCDCRHSRLPFSLQRLSTAQLRYTLSSRLDASDTSPSLWTVSFLPPDLSFFATQIEHWDASRAVPRTDSTRHG